MDWVQGNIVPGFHKDFQDFVFVRFENAADAKRWLTALLPSVQVSSARNVARYNRAFKAHRSGGAVQPSPTQWANIAFSRHGLESLGVPGWDRLAEDFKATPSARAWSLARGDGASWLWGGVDDAEPDAMLILGADSLSDLVALRQRSGVDDGLVTVQESYSGATLGGGREPFGFKDGISQPVPDVLAEDGTWPVNEQFVEPGKFILMPPRGTEPSWALDGSYAVFIRFIQHVDEFAREMTRGTVALVNDGIPHMTPDLLKAKIVGRWTDGTPLVDDFSADPNGEICPLFAHVRKAFPRSEADAQDHRIIRRGIPYAKPDDAKVERGMLFLAYQANISEQFAHVFMEWLGESFFPQAAQETLLAATSSGSGGTSPLRMPGPDTITSADSRRWRFARPGRDVVTDPDAFATLAMQRFVTLTALGYFFAPSIRALQTVPQFTH